MVIRELFLANSWRTVFYLCWMLGVFFFFCLVQTLTNAGALRFYFTIWQPHRCIFLASTFAASSVHLGDLCVVSEGSTEDSFPETVLIKRAVVGHLPGLWLAAEIYSFIPTWQWIFACAGAAFSNEVKLSVERESYGSARSTLRGV